MILRLVAFLLWDLADKLSHAQKVYIRKKKNFAPSKFMYTAKKHIVADGFIVFSVQKHTLI